MVFRTERCGRNFLCLRCSVLVNPNQSKENKEVFRNLVLVIIFGIVGIRSCLQDKVDRANQAAAAPPVCRQYEGTSDFATCQLDPAPYQFRHDQLVAEEKARLETESEASTRPVEIPTTTPDLPPTRCEVIDSGDTVSTIVVEMIGYWPWDGEGLPTGTLISVESDFNGDGIREARVFQEENGVEALPSTIFPGDKICVAVR